MGSLINQIKPTLKRYLPPILYLLLALFALLLSILKPYYNWDLIAYVASAKSYEEKEIKKLHSFTYEQIENSVSESTWEELTGSQDNNIDQQYRRIIHTDPTAFAEQLPFYQIRSAYPILMYLFYKLGIPIVFPHSSFQV
jgi:hypothetical protein